VSANEIPIRSWRVEWPTVLLAFVIYGLWFALTWFWQSIPIWLLAPIGGWSIAWQMNLQHEIIHGHPTGNRTINRLIGIWPLALWLPYSLYRRSHLQHHNDERLTDPLDDPESYYWTNEDWQSVSRVGRALVRMQSTLLGRIMIGPVWSCTRLWTLEGRRAIRNERGARREIVEHLAQVCVVLAWVLGVCRMPFTTYLFCFVYAGTALAMVRSFAEHRAESEAERRTAIVENSWILGTLFLFNNLHVAHHMRPNLPWYMLPGWYAKNREALIARNGGLLYDSYFDIFRRYFLRRHDQTLHPYRPSSVAAPERWVGPRG
jgi:fatty acid desaturase